MLHTSANFLLDYFKKNYYFVYNSLTPYEK